MNRVKIPHYYEGFLGILRTGGNGILFRKGTHTPNWPVVVRRVKSRRVGCRLYIEDGWKTFVEDNDIRVGDVVKIGYKIRGSFIVRVVRDGAEIVAIDWEKDGEYAGLIEPPTPETPIARRGRKSALDGKSIELAKVRKRLGELKRNQGLPSIGVLVTKSYISLGEMNVPLPFARQHLNDLDEVNNF